MIFLKRYAIVLFISLLIFLIIISIFSPIFRASSLVFPYSVSKFDIVIKYPKVWFYIKLVYCISCFFNLYLLVNSVYKFILFKNPKIKFKTNIFRNKNNSIKKENYNLQSFNLLLGTNALNKEKIIIPEKGLYQNLLITGTIGSRENRFLYVPIFKPIIKMCKS